MASVDIRYARALADVVFEQKMTPAAASKELDTMVALFEESTDLRRVWETPAIPSDQKRGILDAIVKRAGVSRIIRNFIAVLIDHERVRNLSQIARQFQTELNERLGLVDAEITSARELSATERKEMEKQIEQLAGSKVRARYETDVTLLGGAVIRLGSKIYDGSVRGQLARIKEQLSAD